MSKRLTITYGDEDGYSINYTCEPDKVTFSVTDNGAIELTTGHPPGFFEQLTGTQRKPTRRPQRQPQLANEGPAHVD